ncbi:hypothetical protein [Streptomyces hygroscopicus]|uniref:hypothetical protein n=1 Tax=Streptomyces hygroscopicus TaxID=1912 RepID=UPI00223FF2C8|nr:hypothetical protein [Streptomyces hygroscopicus]
MAKGRARARVPQIASRPDELDLSQEQPTENADLKIRIGPLMVRTRLVLPSRTPASDALAAVVWALSSVLAFAVPALVGRAVGLSPAACVYAGGVVLLWTTTVAAVAHVLSRRGRRAPRRSRRQKSGGVRRTTSH